MNEAYFQRLESRMIKLEAQVAELHNLELKHRSADSMAEAGVLLGAFVIGLLLVRSIANFFKGE